MAAVGPLYRPDIETEMETNRRFNGIEPLSSRKAIVYSSSVVTATVAPLGVGLMLWWLSTFHASVAPFWAPWEFSWAQFLSIWMTVWWYIRGLSLTASDHRPPILRQISFFAGMLIVYTMVQTRFEYLAEHMFFFNRLQHIGMHHVGPLLVAFSWPGDVIMRGMPASLRQLGGHRVVRACVNVVQQPVIAAFLFVGLIAFWLIPSVHFRAMIDPRLFAIMNWSMVVDGILFWCLVLDPRPTPPARLSFGARATLAIVVMFPQILLGAAIALTGHNLYSFYDLCGRIYPTIDARTDQAIGGLIIWIPASMMSVLGLGLVVDALRRIEETHKDSDDGSSGSIPASLWTGQ